MRMTADDVARAYLELSRALQAVEWSIQQPMPNRWLQRRGRALDVRGVPLPEDTVFVLAKTGGRRATASERSADNAKATVRRKRLDWSEGI